MMYVTELGDEWDKIAYEVLGSENYTGDLIQANLKYSEYVVFPSGIELNIPVVNTETTDLPPWKTASDFDTDCYDEFEEEDD